MRRLIVAAALTVASVVLPHAQARYRFVPRPSGLVVGSGNFFSPIVANLERSVALYREGLEIEGAANAATADDNAALRNMFGLPQGKIRWSVVRPAGLQAGLEIVEIAQPRGKALSRSIQDPGAVTLVVWVRNLARTVTNFRAKHVKVVSTPPEPVDTADNGEPFSGITFRDDDGHFIELREAKGQAPFNFNVGAPASANVIGARVRVTVDSVARAVALYRDALGLAAEMEVPPPEWTHTPTLLHLVGLRNAERQVAMLTVPTSGLFIEFAEYRGVSRRTVHAALQDPGSTRLQLRVRDLDAAINAVVAAGGQVISTGGMPVALPAGRGAPTRAAIVRDPNNLFLVLIAAPV
jgi:catechol 2,3-dioxygenase-like lactoylglutathione lyase family enzyme